ncbi:hypothetical protein D1007_15543 [Hordeum vulgare]|nr:hypothetical protein D1007_15543 [Hordeum vulgare]
MITNKDSREEKHGQDKEEQIRAIMEIQKKERTLKTEKQAKMLEIEATRAREVWLACMANEAEIMKVNLSTTSPKKRSWFEKMQDNILNLDDECGHDHNRDGLVEL